VARSEQWRRVGRYRHHHRRPRSRRRRLASLQSFAPRLLPSPTSPRVAVNAVASAEVVALVGDDAAVAAAAFATATAQVEPSTSSSLPILWKLSGWRSSGAVSTAGATVGRSDARCCRQRLTSALPLALGRRRFLCDASFSNLRHFAYSSPASSMLLVPDWLARTLLMAQAPSMWRDSLS
jgi:hypothetical protein